MSTETELEKEIFEAMLSVPTKEPVTQVQLEVMRRASKLFATTVDGSIIKQAIVEFVRNPQNVLQDCKETGDSSLIRECEKTIDMIEDARVAQKQRIQ